MTPVRKKIYLDRWLAFHPYKKPGSSDYYYLELASRLRIIIDSEKHDYLVSLLDEEEDIENLCCCLACYLEDIVSETGIWQAFTGKHRELYRKDLPFYKTVEYYHEEINAEDIYFLLWYFFSTAVYDEMIISPQNVDLYELGSEVYNLLDEEYERAPENDRLKEFLTLSPGEEDFFVIRMRIEFIILDSYLFPFNRLECFVEVAERMEDMKDQMEDYEMEQNMPLMMYETVDTYILSKIFPLLALRGKDWLAYVLGREHPLFDDIISISEKKTGYYLYQKKENGFLYFEHIATRTVLPVTVKSYNTLPELIEGKTILTCSFVKWKNNWWFSGTSAVYKYNSDFIAKEKESIQSRNLFDGMVQKQYEVLQKQYKAFLEFNKGESIAFFESSEMAGNYALEFMEFYKKSLHVSDKEEKEAVKRAQKKGLPGMPGKLDFDDEVKGLPGFVFFNPESGIEIAYGFNEFIPHPDNPFYDKEKCRESAIEVLASQEISKECSLYLVGLMEPGSLRFPGEPDGRNLEDNLDFVLRYWKSKNYYSKPEITLI